MPRKSWLSKKLQRPHAPYDSSKFIEVNASDVRQHIAIERWKLIRKIVDSRKKVVLIISRSEALGKSSTSQGRPEKDTLSSVPDCLN